MSHHLLGANGMDADWVAQLDPAPSVVVAAVIWRGQKGRTNQGRRAPPAVVSLNPWSGSCSCLSFGAQSARSFIIQRTSALALSNRTVPAFEIARSHLLSHRSVVHPRRARVHHSIHVNRRPPSLIPSPIANVVPTRTSYFAAACPQHQQQYAHVYPSFAPYNTPQDSRRCLLPNNSRAAAIGQTAPP